MIVARKIAYNVAVSSISKIVSTILALVSIGLITRYLGKEGFGNYATALAFLSFFSAMADLGLNATSTREISRPGANENEIMSKIFTFRVAISIVVLILSPIVVLFFPYPLEVKEAIIIVAASFLFSSSYQILNGVFQKNLAMDKVAISELIGKIIQVLVIFLAIQFDLGFLWIISSLLFYMILNFSLIYLWSRKYLILKLKFDSQYLKKFLRESYPIGVAVFITFIYFKVDTILLSVIKSSAEVGIYNVAYKVIENITFFPAMIVGLIFPIISKNIFSDKNRFKDILNKTYKFFWIFIVPLIVGTLFLSDSIVRVIGGTGFPESAGVLRILIFALAFIFFGNFSNAILIAGNQQKKLMIVLSLAAIFNVVTNLIFIPQYSYLAAAATSLFTEMIVVIGTFWVVYKELKYFPSMEKILSIVASGGIMATFLYLFKNTSVFLSGIAAIGIYLIALWAFKAIKTEEITSIIGRKDIKEYGEIS